MSDAVEMDETVARYTLTHAERLLVMYERAVRARGEQNLTPSETVEYRALLRRLRGRARAPASPTTASPSP